MHIPDVNLLPSTERLWDGKAERFAWALLLVGWLLFLLALVVNIQSANALRALEARAVGVRREAAQAEQQLAQREARLQEIVETLRHVNRLETELDALRRQGPPFSQILEDIRAALPPRVSVHSIQTQESRVVVEGEAGSPSLVIEFVRALREEGTATNVVVDRIEHRDLDASPSTVYFRLILEYE